MPNSEQSVSRRADRRDPSLVAAAGAVIWRPARTGLEVVLVHRPRYDDWSWPKGKLEGQESFPAAGFREVLEETGLRIRLGVPLPSAHYRLSDHSDKTVRYWAARGSYDPLPKPPRPGEVDRTEWVSAQDAASRLSRRGDRVQLEALIEGYDSGLLDTYPFIVVRHGYARPRHVWGREDGDRPLIDAGRAQARNLVGTLGAWQPGKVFSSPWVRCLQTVQPYSKKTGAKIKTKGKLSEDGHRKDRQGTARLVSKLIGKEETLAVCTHRPVLGTVLGVLAGHAAAGRADDLPRRDPFMEAGEVLVAHIQRRTHRVVAVERHLTSSTG
ncbi:MAG: NUDIX hydrolase [Actinomycetales bacterium]